jgi:hypothetical protein
MAFDQFYADAESRGGSWVKVKEAGDRAVGTIVDIDIRDRRDMEGNVVIGKKSGKPRKEYVVTYEVDDRDGPDDDGIRKLSLNESGQSAFVAAYKAAGGGDISGARFALQVTAGAPDKFSQASYACSIKKGAKPVTVPVDELI